MDAGNGTWVVTLQLNDFVGAVAFFAEGSAAAPPGGNETSGPDIDDNNGTKSPAGGEEGIPAPGTMFAAAVLALAAWARRRVWA